jgi:hypothetical protein
LRRVWRYGIPRNEGAYVPFAVPAVGEIVRLPAITVPTF